jgi:hypothetical protein
VRIEDDGTVVLSERNLLTLLSKLYTPGSECEIGGGNEYAPGLHVRAETDAAHYQDRPFPPGPMHPETERILRAIQQADPGPITPI